MVCQILLSYPMLYTHPQENVEADLSDHVNMLRSKCVDELTSCLYHYYVPSLSPSFPPSLLLSLPSLLPALPSSHSQAHYLC